MAVNLSPVGGVAAQFLDSNGNPLTGGKLYTYAAGTTTPIAAYTSSNGATAWTNPIVLDAAGRVPSSGEIWLTDGIIYKFLLKTSADVLIATYDNISGINSNFVSFVNQQEIITATSGQTVFPLAISYQPATNSLSVFVDGVNQYGPGATYAYTETDSTTVTFITGLHVGAEVKFTTTQQQSAGSVDASQVSYQPPFTASVQTNVEAKLAQTVSVLDFGADPTGVADSGDSIRAAVTAVTLNGGQVYFPAGTYKVTAASGDTSNTAIYVPSYVRLTGASQVGTKIIPGANNTVCFRVQGLNGGIENLQIDNPGNTYTNVSGIRLAPTEEAGITVRSDIEFNNFTNLSIRRCIEAITLRPGPTVGGQDSYCYYNTFTNIDIRNCTRGIWLKVPPTQPGSGSNRNTFISCRVGETGTNTGLTIDAGDTCKFVACSFEGIDTGTSPNVVPTAIQIAYNTATYGCVNNQFYGTIIEACTRDMDNDNDLTQMYGWFHTGAYYSPSSRELVVDMQNTGISSIAIGTNRIPTVQGDFFVNNGASIVKVSTGIGGQAEFSVDTGTAYGVYSFYNSGVKAWSFGTQATGGQHLTFFDAADAQMGQFRDTGVFSPLQASAAPAYLKGAMYFDTTLNKLRIGGATAWETVTSV